jgi:hypothetical protein
MRSARVGSGIPELDMDWMSEAWCRRMPDLPWIADKCTAPVVLGELIAQICESCPVRQRCEQFVAEAQIVGGYWAGAHRHATWVQGALFGDVA